jgi:hypothetical protein
VKNVRTYSLLTLEPVGHFEIEGEDFRHPRADEHPETSEKSSESIFLISPVRIRERGESL